MSCLQNWNFSWRNAHSFYFPSFLPLTASHTGTVTSGISYCCFLEEKMGFIGVQGTLRFYMDTPFSHTWCCSTGHAVGKTPLLQRGITDSMALLELGTPVQVLGAVTLCGAWSTITELAQTGVTARCPHLARAGCAFQGKCWGNLWVFLAGD